MKEPELHSPEWFKAWIAQTKAEIKALPPWLRDALKTASASFPKIPE